MDIRFKRAYERAQASDGYRVLVDRLWSRGVSKEKARIKLWLKQIAPSTELRKWFAHDPKKWVTFPRRYFKEPKERPEVVDQLLEHVRVGRATLVYGAKDDDHNDAVAFKEYLESQEA